MSLTYLVELDLSGSAFGTTFSGTDETSYTVTSGGAASAINVTWGRQDEFSTVSPTSVSGSFKNPDGRFTPGLTTGALYPKIRRGLRRRVTVTANSTAVKISEDYATGLTVVPDKVLQTTEVSGQDILARLAGTPSSETVSSTIVGTALRSFLAEEMLLDSPSALYMLQEEDGATSFADVTGAKAPATIGSSKYGAGVVTAGETPAGNFQAGSMVAITNAAFPTWVSSDTIAASWVAMPAFGPAIELWVQTPTQVGAGDATIIHGFDPIGSGFFLNLSPTSFGQFQLAVFGTGVLHANADARPYLDGKVHQFYITWAANGTSATLYVDGVQVASGTSAAWTPATPPVVNIGANIATYVLSLATVPVEPISAEYAYVGMWASDIGATRVLAHYNAGANAFHGERTDTRITRLLSYRTNTGSVLDTGLSTMGAQDIQGRSLTDCLLEVGQVEAGAVYVDGQGRVNFRSRSRLFNPTPVLTLDCSQGSVDFGSNFTDTTQNALNDVTVTGSTGSDQRFYNAASITADGELSTSTSLPLNADSDALNMAGWMVANGVQEQIVASPLNVDLLNCPAATALGVLQLAPLDCIQVTNCPTGAPASTLKFIVQGGSLSLAVDAASASLNTTLMPPAVAVWDSTNWDATPVWAF